jgi:hypothetical protein
MDEKLRAPWKVGPYDPRYVFDKNGEEIAFVPNHFDNAVPQARLIAAAPDLLEACQAVETAITTERIYEAQEMVSAAIAKATGE